MPRFRLLSLCLGLTLATVAFAGPAQAPRVLLLGEVHDGIKSLKTCDVLDAALGVPQDFLSIGTRTGSHQAGDVVAAGCQKGDQGRPNKTTCSTDQNFHWGSSVTRMGR